MKRLRHFCRKNTSDYFIHKNLDGFLKQELEFYIKDQVLHSTDIETSLGDKLRTLRVVRQLAEEVSQFLAQIEDVQRRLFEKRKFVLRSDYLVPIINVPRELWKEVLLNKPQVDAWEELFAIKPRKDLFNQKGKVNDQFLEEHSTLVVNTSYFEEAFKERLLATFDDIDKATDGLLIHSENYQALRLLERKYTGKIKCIYIDPPYNTGSDEFIYKDRYQHSTWAAMMTERIGLARGLLSPCGVLFSSIDFNEIATLRLILEQIFKASNLEGIITWRRRYNQPNDKTKMLGLVSEYILSFAKDSASLRTAGVGKLDLTGRFSNPDNDPRGDWASKPWKVGSGQSGTCYKITTPTGKSYDEEWMGEETTFKSLLKDKRIIFPNDGDGPPRKKYFKYEREEEGQCATNWWSHDQFGHNASASDQIADILGIKTLFDNPKPTELIRGVIQVSGREVEWVMDFFAGSGTTGHAILNLNRQDGDRRKFVLVEMAKYFNTLILPRIQRVIYTPEWKDGKPLRLPTKEEIARTPRLIKILALEGYEDALHNISVEDTLKRELPRAKAHKEKIGADQYRLSYLVRLPLSASDSMLNLEKLEQPFGYTIEVLSDDGPRTQKVDLVETFNFLYGLHVERLETWRNEQDKRAYRIVKARNNEDHRILVLWRDIDKLDPKIERTFLEGKLKDEKPFDEMWINCDTATPGIKSLDGLFKRLMEEEKH